MTRSDSLLPVDGPGAPPRANGELVFEAPWESRLFGVTMALHEQGVFPWPEFQQRLIAAIADWERRETSEPYPYYRCWMTALESLLAERHLCAPSELDQRVEAFTARPHGHDHVS